MGDNVKGEDDQPNRVLKFSQAARPCLLRLKEDSDRRIVKTWKEGKVDDVPDIDPLVRGDQG